MKIVINAASAKMGGAVSYITNLLRHLPEADRNAQFLVFLPPETAVNLQGLDRNIRVLPTQIGHAGMHRRMWWEQLTLRRFLKRERVDALFSTANFGMFRCPVRQLVLVRNSLYFSRTYREMFLQKHSWQYRLTFALRRRLIAQSVRTADVVMTPTQAMLDELCCYVEVKSAVVNPYGVAVPKFPEALQEPAMLGREEARKKVLRLLYVSLYSEHKNLSTLLKALSILNRNGHAKFQLTTTADPGWSGAAWTLTRQDDLNLGRQAGIAEHVNFAGPLSREEIAKLYRHSDIFVFPSLTESFGFPMAEAMCHGLPIVAADTAVNRELCGEAAVYFKPLSPEDLAGSLLSLARDKALCNRLGETGMREAASRFSWNTHAQRVAGIVTGTCERISKEMV